VGDDAWAAALGGNLLAPMELIRAVLGGMRTRRFGRIVNITSGLVKSPTPEMVLSVSARAALMTLAKAVQTDTLADNVTINNLLPGPFRTDRLKALAQTIAASDGISVEEAFARLGARTCRAHRRSGGIWRLLRLSVLGAGGLHFGPEPADRRRGYPGLF
jgi:3-oxoacyl-[acyl-carrier protein] reductase